MNFSYPSLLDRTKSILYDTIFIIGIMFAFSEILNFFTEVPNWVKVALFLLILMYEPLCTAFGVTLGQDKMDIRVRKLSDETKRINIFQALIRFVFKYFFGWLSFITLFTNKKKRAIHDIVSGSVMISVDNVL